MRPLMRELFFICRSQFLTTRISSRRPGVLRFRQPNPFQEIFHFVLSLSLINYVLYNSFFLKAEGLFFVLLSFRFVIIVMGFMILIVFIIFKVF